MKNLFKVLGNLTRAHSAKVPLVIIALVAVIGFTFAACDDGSGGGGGGPQKATYISTDANGNTYTLEINESGERSARSAAQSGDAFKLIVEFLLDGGGNLKLEYTGNISAAQASGATVSLTLNINGENITITIVGTEMTVITGKFVNGGKTVVDNPSYITPVTSGGGSNSSLNGIWVDEDSNELMVLNNGRFSASYEDAEAFKGTYTGSSAITFTVTQINGAHHEFSSFLDPKWYTKDDFIALGISNEDVNEIFPIFTGTASGNTLTLTADGSTGIFIRQGGGSGTNQFIGTWYGTGGSGLTLAFNNTHWAMTNAEGGAGYGPYTYNGTTATLTDSSNVKVTVTISGGTLTLVYGGSNFTFTKTPSGGGDTSLDGVWIRSNSNVHDGNVYTISGNGGVFTQITTSDVYQSAVSKGFISVGGEAIRIIHKTGDNTWTAQLLNVYWTGNYTGVASGVVWSPLTLTLSKDGQTISFDGDSTASLTRRQPLDGTWQASNNGHTITISGSSGVYNQIGTGTYWQTALSKGNINVGSIAVKNLTKTSDNTWTGEVLNANSDGSLFWVNCTITLAANGQTFTMVDGNNTSTFTKQGGTTPGGGISGTFTLTGIPSTYNGKYAFFSDASNPVQVVGFQSTTTETVTLSSISGGRASIPLWNNSGNYDVRYTGNGSFICGVSIYNSQSLLGTSEEIGTLVFLVPVAFSNGSATRAWSDGIYVPKGDPIPTTYSLDGVWRETASNSFGRVITISGSTGTLTSYTSLPPLWQDGLSKGHFSIGGVHWRNLTSTGNLTWSGEWINLTYYNNASNVSVGPTWASGTWIMSADGQTLNNGEWTRRQ